MKLLVSACLVGTPCRYDGGHYEPDRLLALPPDVELIPVCPERLGGLPTPRSPSERREGKVFSRDGVDCTCAFETGARLALDIARKQGCRCALLKEKSPSCGSRWIYDGSFTGKLVPGQGVAAALLQQNGIAVFSEEEIGPLLNWIETQR